MTLKNKKHYIKTINIQHRLNNVKRAYCKLPFGCESPARCGKEAVAEMKILTYVCLSYRAKSGSPSCLFGAARRLGA